MNGHDASERYGRLTIALHWLMLLLIIAVYACMELREFYPRGSDPREALKAWHFTLGLTVFALVWVRLLARLIGPRPAINPPLPAWQALGARLLHVVLYAFMIVMPLAGWLILSASGATIPFWFTDLPALVAENEALAETVEDLHETIGSVGYWLIGLHAAAGLYHHYIRRDDALRRILPFAR